MVSVQIKMVSTNGQITLGTRYTGRNAAIDEVELGVWIINVGHGAEHRIGREIRRPFYKPPQGACEASAVTSLLANSSSSSTVVGANVICHHFNPLACPQ